MVCIAAQVLLLEKKISHRGFRKLIGCLLDLVIGKPKNDENKKKMRANLMDCDHVVQANEL